MYIYSFVVAVVRTVVTATVGDVSVIIDSIPALMRRFE